MGVLTLDDDAKLAFAHLQKLIFANNSGCMPELSERRPLRTPAHVLRARPAGVSALVC